MPRRLRLLFPFLLVFSASCSTAPIREGGSPEATHRAICARGEANRLVTGSLWVWAEGAAGSAQFPLLVRAEEGRTLLEVVDLLGAPQARIERVGGRTRVQGERARGIDRGLLLALERIHGPVLERVLLGRFPCSAGVPRWEGEGTLVFPGGDRAVVGRWAGGPWLEEWKSGSTVWEFRRPAEDGAPQEWTVRWEFEGRTSELRARWRDRRADARGI